jgi:uncharacterized repeat protein (TIGR04138 family)
MQQTNFDEAFELIWARDQRYPREAYLFVQEALDHTQKVAIRSSRTRMRHVSGQELLEGIREYALAQFGPMAEAVFEEWRIRSCQDFGEIVFNLVEAPVSARFTKNDFQDSLGFLAKLQQQVDPLSGFLWTQFQEEARQALSEVNSDRVATLLAEELSRIIVTIPIYEAKRFASVRLSEHAQSLAGHHFAGVQLARLNRLLLQEAYPAEIAKGPGLLAKTEKDSRTDFEGGYDFWEAFRKPFLPSKIQGTRRREANATRA